MTRLFRGLLMAGLAVGLLGGSARADALVKHPLFADLTHLNLQTLVPPPPDAGSLAGRADLETDLQVQAHRTPDQIAWAKFAQNYHTFPLFAAGNLLGPNFTPAKLPHLAAFMDNLRAEIAPVYEALKGLYRRPRPFAANSRVLPCVERPTGLNQFSYPSGHSFQAYFWAATLAEVFPDKRAALYERARSIAWSRIVGGVHYPTDLEAGRRLAETILSLERSNPAYQAALAECRLEAAAAGSP